MLKFVLLFIAVTIADTQENCSSESWNICFEIVTDMAQVRDNEEDMCRLAKKAERCFKVSGCQTEKTYKYILDVVAGCVNSKETDCDLTKMFKCASKVFKKLHKERIICQGEQQLKPCYSNNKCDSVFEWVEIALKTICAEGEPQWPLR